MTAWKYCSLHAVIDGALYYIKMPMFLRGTIKINRCSPRRHFTIGTRTIIFLEKRLQIIRNLRFVAQFSLVETAKRYRDGNHGIHDEEGYTQKERQVEKERVGGLRWIFSSSDIFPQFRIGQSNGGRTILNAWWDLLRNGIK